MGSSGGVDLSGYEIRVPAKADYGKLRKIAFFDVFKDDADLASIASGGTWLGCPKDTRLMSEGDLEHDFFVVVKGEVKVSSNGKVLGCAGPGELLGEMGALLHEKRSADAFTCEDTILFRLHVTAFNNLPLSVVFPVMVFIYRLAARRLQRMGKELAGQ